MFFAQCFLCVSVEAFFSDNFYIPFSFYLISLSLVSSISLFLTCPSFPYKPCVICSRAKHSSTSIVIFSFPDTLHRYASRSHIRYLGVQDHFTWWSSTGESSWSPYSIITLRSKITIVADSAFLYNHSLAKALHFLLCLFRTVLYLSISSRSSFSYIISTISLCFFLFLPRLVYSFACWNESSREARVVWYWLS